MVLAQKILFVILGYSLLSLLTGCPDKNHPEARAPQANIALMIVQSERIEPVAIYQAKSQKWLAPLQELGDISDPQGVHQGQQTQIQRYLPLNQPLELYQMGQNMGQFIPQKSGLFGCGDFAHVSGRYSRPELKSQALITFSREFQGKKTFAAPVWSVPQLNRIAYDLAYQTFEKAGLTMNQGPLKILSYEPFSLETEQSWKKVLFVSAQIPAVDGTAGCGQATLWLIAEGENPYQMQVKYFELNKANDSLDTCGDHQLVSNFALNSHVNHFLIANSGYEWWDYEIIHRHTDGKYQKIYRGGGGGC